MPYAKQNILYDYVLKIKFNIPFLSNLSLSWPILQFIVGPNICYNRLMTYNWQQADWTEFKYDIESVEDVLFSIAKRVKRVSGILKGLPEKAQTDAMIDIMVSEAIKTSEIEGEYLSRQDMSVLD